MLANCKNCKVSFTKEAPTQSFCSLRCNLLFSHSVNENGCWIWKKAMGADGYGRMRYKKKYIRPHRASYEEFHHEIQNELLVLHKCDCRLCINPAHLFLGTNADNQNDMRSKGRDRKYSVLRNEDVLKIRSLHEQGMTQHKISKLFKTSHGHVWQIVHRKIWKKVA